ncbi:MAG: glutathione S-transferase, partial [Planctomycetota bacterium]
MKLYAHPGSCSSACHIALNEVGQDFELVKFNLFGDRILPDGRNFNDINPKGSVPVLELDNGELLTEVSAILQYIADLHPQSGLAPANGTLERVRMQEWLSYLNSELHMTIGMFFSPALDGEMKEFMTQRKDKRLKYVDDHLANNNYLLGDKVSVADAYLYIILTWPTLMLKMDISEYKNITAYQARMAERQAVK